jgi:hypothetical protein
MMGNRDNFSGLPRNYAKGKEKRLIERWNGELGECLRRMAPIAWPGVDSLVFLGFTGFAKQSENTTEAVDAQTFHEIGLFQVEAGLRNFPAPNPDPNGKYSAWAYLSVPTKDSDGDRRKRLHALTVQMLGKLPSMKPNEWKKLVPDQAAVGLANLRRHLGNIEGKLPDDVKPKSLGSTWAVLLGFTAFSRGSGQLWKCLQPYVDKLALVPEEQRWQAWERMVAYDIENKVKGIGIVPYKRGAAYAIIRSRQKHDSGRNVAEKLGLSTSWFLTPDPRIDQILTDRAYTK